MIRRGEWTIVSLRADLLEVEQGEEEVEEASGEVGSEDLEPQKEGTSQMCCLG